MKKISEVIALLLGIVLMFAACGDSDKSSNSDSNTLSPSDNNEDVTAKMTHLTEIPEGYIGIYTADDLKNAGINENGNYILMNDLDLSSIEDWQGITNNAVFDGNNYSISNLYSTTGGLFKKSNEVKNLHIKDCLIDVVCEVEKNKFVGGITDIGKIITNCTVSGEIYLVLSNNCGITKDYAVGGLMGYQEKSSDMLISHCKNYANVSGQTTDTSGRAYNLHVGGISGYGLSVEFCSNDGEIKLKGGDFDCNLHDESAAGGIVGGLIMCDGRIAYCANNGKVTSEYYGGGILGYCYQQSDSTELVIDSCYNTAPIMGVKTASGESTYVGGICGYTKHYIEMESSESRITNCYNVGDCSSADYCGAILGGGPKYDKTNIQYCAYNNQNGLNITGVGAMFADNKAMSLEEMKNINNYPFNNKETVWQNSKNDYQYPIFKNMGV